MKLHSSMVMLGLLASFGSHSAWAYDTNFPDAIFPLGSQIAGNDGWTISDPGFSGNLVNTVPSLSFANANFNDVSTTNNAAELGGFYDVPLASSPTTVVLSHATPNQLQHAAFKVDFLIQPSSVDFPGRDGFGFSFRDASNSNLIRISLTPVTGGAGDAYQVSYTVGASDPVIPTNVLSELIYAHDSTVHTLTVAFTPNGANPTLSVKLVSYDIDGVISKTDTFTGSASGLGSANVARFGAEWNATDVGDNGLVFDNLQVVQPVQLAVTSSGSNLNFSWPSRAGKIYTLRTSTGLATAPATWDVVSGSDNIAAAPPLNTQSLVRPADTKRFYVIEESLAP